MAEATSSSKTTSKRSRSCSPPRVDISQIPSHYVAYLPQENWDDPLIPAPDQPYLQYPPPGVDLPQPAPPAVSPPNIKQAHKRFKQSQPTPPTSKSPTCTPIEYQPEEQSYSRPQPRSPDPACEWCCLNNCPHLVQHSSDECSCCLLSAPTLKQLQEGKLVPSSTVMLTLMKTHEAQEAAFREMQRHIREQNNMVEAIIQMELQKPHYGPTKDQTIQQQERQINTLRQAFQSMKQKHDELRAKLNSSTSALQAEKYKASKLEAKVQYYLTRGDNLRKEVQLLQEENHMLKQENHLLNDRIDKAETTN